VKPVFTYATPQRKSQTSWRPWGGIQTQEDADKEIQRIRGELEKIRAGADFPVKFLPVAAVKTPDDVKKLKDVASADAILVYAAGGSVLNAIAELKKDTIFFVRHRSGPVYLWYEIVHPRHLRQHKDTLADIGADYEDVVVDSLDDVTWRLRALCGLKNAMGKRIVAVGGPSGWACREAPDLARDRWKLDIRTVNYEELGKLIQAARKDNAAVKRAQARAEKYLKEPGIKLDTKRSYVDNAFLLEQIFRDLMKRANAHAMTINQCMGTIMPISETTACLPLMLLNDAGYMAFCESDFVVIPSGIVLGSISGKPMFLNDPTYPHHGMITLAHCTGPSMMDGKTREPTRVMTHFESDYGAAPKVDMGKGQKVTNIVPDFKEERWVGLLGEIIDHPLLPICRSQIDIRYEVDDGTVAENMPGFHWMTGYGDYMREMGYALKKTPVAWKALG